MVPLSWKLQQVPGLSIVLIDTKVFNQNISSWAVPNPLKLCLKYWYSTQVCCQSLENLRASSWHGICKHLMLTEMDGGIWRLRDKIPLLEALGEKKSEQLKPVSVPGWDINSSHGAWFQAGTSKSTDAKYLQSAWEDKLLKGHKWTWLKLIHCSDLTG